MHTACERDAITVFMKHSFKDNSQEFQIELVVIVSVITFHDGSPRGMKPTGAFMDVMAPVSHSRIKHFGFS